MLNPGYISFSPIPQRLKARSAPVRMVIGAGQELDKGARRFRH
jgi:hypothetical protein